MLCVFYAMRLTCVGLHAVPSKLTLVWWLLSLNIIDQVLVSAGLLVSLSVWWFLPTSGELDVAAIRRHFSTFQLARGTI